MLKRGGGTNLPLFHKGDDFLITYILLGISLIFIILCNRHVRKFRAFSDLFTMLIDLD